MERDGVAHRVPVRFWCEPWIDGSVLPLAIDFSRARYNAVILLYDDVMAASDVKKHWESYVEGIHKQIAERGSVDLYMAFGDPAGASPLSPDLGRDKQYSRRDSWKNSISPEGLGTHLLLHAVFKIRDHLKRVFKTRKDEPLFVSHAKIDGDDTASSIVDYVNSRNNDVPLETFYDAKELSPGDNFANAFKDAIDSGTLLAIVSDAYDSRPWCVFELTEAKRARRPIVLADVGRVRVSRTYPYGANVPKVRINPVAGETAWIEPLLVECLSEGLRCDLFNLEVSSRLGVTGDDVMVLPRPPELFDIIDCAIQPTRVIYPDPPLARLEAELINKALKRMADGTVMLQTLSEIS
ncbi:toll/interleukin-1 receptor domain-containing protein [Rhizobium tubonense]|nr:toll/interleukin-1 receptor domain-containing protein [Rhizobium tubonense]